MLQADIDQPGALVIQDVGADFADVLRQTITVEPIICDLEPGAVNVSAYVDAHSILPESIRPWAIE